MTIDLQDLYPEKREICKKIIDYFKNNRMGYIKVPTGWGKTYLTKHLMKKYYDDGKIVLFLASRNNQLLNQTFYDNEYENKPIFQNSLLLSSENVYKDPNELITKINQNEEGIVVFASLQTILGKKNQIIKDTLCKNADLVVIDEIHNFIFNHGNDLINEISENAKILGMTATPFQGVVGNVKFVGDISGDMNEIFNKSLPRCIIEGQLTELNYKIIRSNINILEIFNFENGLNELKNNELFLDCGSLEKINFIIQRTYAAKKVYDDQIKLKNSKTLIFCAPVRNIVRGFIGDIKKITAFHAKICSAIFNEEINDGLNDSISFNNYFDSGEIKNAVFLSSDLRKEERNEILKAFKNVDKPPFVLCSVGMLIEGFDFPDLENLILLRPTLSMRLFEQQVGRVTRLPQKSNIKRGNIYEMVDEIDSLYDTFGDSVFGEKNIDRIQMLQPENRIEQLLFEEDTIEAVESNKIEVSEIDFNNSTGEFQVSPVQVPPTNLKIKFFCRLVSLIVKKDEGALKKERIELLGFAKKFKVHNIDDAIEISKIITSLENLEHQASKDTQLSSNCRINKTKLFFEVRWLLKLEALTYLKYSCHHLDIKEKNAIIKILGFNNDFTEIDKIREMCLQEGHKRTIKQMLKSITLLKELTYKNYWLPKKQIHKLYNNFKISIYWASCFINDNHEIEELFESKEWDYKMKNILVGKYNLK